MILVQKWRIHKNLWLLKITLFFKPFIFDIKNKRASRIFYLGITSSKNKNLIFSYLYTTANLNRIPNIYISNFKSIPLILNCTIFLNILNHLIILITPTTKEVNSIIWHPNCTCSISFIFYGLYLLPLIIFNTISLTRINDFT